MYELNLFNLVKTHGDIGAVITDLLLLGNILLGDMGMHRVQP